VDAPAAPAVDGPPLLLPPLASPLLPPAVAVPPPASSLEPLPSLLPQANAAAAAAQQQASRDSDLDVPRMDRLPFRSRNASANNDHLVVYTATRAMGSARLPYSPEWALLADYTGAEEGGNGRSLQKRCLGDITGCARGPRRPTPRLGGGKCRRGQRSRNTRSQRGWRRARPASRRPQCARRSDPCSTTTAWRRSRRG
jgi:hypothetical protein